MSFSCGAREYPTWRSVKAVYRGVGIVPVCILCLWVIVLCVAPDACSENAVEPVVSEVLTDMPNPAVPYEIVLDLSPGPGNPRNSEGDFISLNNGGILFVYTRFTGGAGDHAAASLVSRFSRDGGATWTAEDAVVLPNEGVMNVMSVSLLRLSDGSIALFYLRKNGEDDCRPFMRLSMDEAVTWGPPTACIPAPIGYYVVNNGRVVQLTSGRLVIPAALHALKGEPFRSRGKALCILSDDLGKTWRPSETMLEAPPDLQTGFQEPGVVELEDGSLFMLLRNSSGVFYRSDSNDGGVTWSQATPTNLQTPVSPASFKRIPGSDTLLLLWNDHKEIPDALRNKRTPLTLAVSRDNGATWEHRVTLEDDPDGWYCYTAIAFTDAHALFAFCAGDTRIMSGLARTRIARVPLTWLLDTMDK